MADLPDTSFNSNVIAEFRANGGKVGGPWQNLTLLLLLHTTGAKSGAPRVNPVGYFDIDGKVIVVGSYAGADIHPAWVHNLRAHPYTRIEIGSETVDVDARELPGDEREAAWARITEIAPPFAKYQTQTNRTVSCSCARMTWKRASRRTTAGCPLPKYGSTRPCRSSGTSCTTCTTTVTPGS